MPLGPLWTEEEVEALQDIFQRHHGREAVHKFRNHARYRGWPTRSKNAVLEKAQRLFGSRNINEENYCLSQLARFLRLPKPRFYAWAKQGHLRVERKHGAYVVPPDAFVEFANQYPHRLNDADPDALYYLLGKELTEKIKGQPPRRPFGVVYLPTGQVFPSIKAAAEATSYSYHAVRWHLVKAKPTLFCRSNKFESPRV